MKKTFKKILCSLLVVVLCLTSAPLQGFVGVEWLDINFDSKSSALEYITTEYTDGYYTYMVIDGKAVITDVNSSISGTVTIPATLGGYKVIKISHHAFENCNDLTSVTIPNCVTTIGNYAFSNCNRLISITILDGVASIGTEAFYKCYSLTSITVDSDNNFYSNDDCGVLFNKNKTNLIQYPIGNSRKTYTIPDSVTLIGDDAFSSCDSLTSIIIPDSVTSVGGSAFYCCYNLQNVTIPNSVISIGDFAFYGCASKSVTIPDSVTTIGDSAFLGCYNLSSIIVDANNNNYSSDKYGVIFDKEKTKLIQYPTGNARTAYTIPYGVTTIGDYAFDNCYSLQSVTIPNSVTSIGDDAFSRCDSLASITIGDNVATIGDYAFYNCDSLQSVIIPNSVTSINQSAFRNCKSLVDVYYEGSEEQWKKISIGVYNSELTNATIHFNSTGIDDSDNDDDTNSTISPDYIKKNYFTQQHLDFVANKNSSFYALATDDFRFAGDLWENAEGGFGQIAAEFAYDVLEGTLEVIFLQFFDGIDCLENPYDAILLDYLASGSTTESFKNILENDMGVICVKIINDLLKTCQSDADWAKDMNILSEIESLITVSDYSGNKLYKALEKLLKGKGTGFVDGIFKTFECFGKVSDVLSAGLSAVDYFVEMMKYTAAIEAYYNSTVSYKKFLSELADEVEAVTIYGNAGEKFRDAYENYASCVTYANAAESVIEYGREKGKTFIQSLAQGVLSKTALTIVSKIFGLSKAAAIKFNAALWAADAGFAISNMLTGNNTIVNCREILRANHILDVASYNIMKSYESGLKKQESYLYAEKFDYAFNFYKNVQLYSLNAYKKHCETSSTKPLSFRKKHFKNELEETVGRIKAWNNIVCHIDFDTELVTAGMMGIHTAVIACPTDIYVYRKSDNKLVACVIDNVSKQYSDEVAIICVGEEKALACDSIDDYRVEIVATGNGSMDVTYSRYSDFETINSFEVTDFKITEQTSYNLDVEKESITVNNIENRTVYFGSYPQSKVVDNEVISALNQLAPEWNDWISYGYYGGGSESSQGDWMRYTDVTYNGDKYRGVKFSNYRPLEFNSSFSGTSNKYQYKNGYYVNTVYWFKFELLEWRVLDFNTGLIVCENIIDAQPFNNTYYEKNGEFFNNSSCEAYACDYETSSIREWLNDDFYNMAFTDDERAEIDITTLNNDGYFTSRGKIGYEKYDSNETMDKIFLLSYNEMINNSYGFDSDSNTEDVIRRAYGSDYSKSQGLCTRNGQFNGSSNWLLRSPGDETKANCIVGESGNSNLISAYVSSTSMGIRPALRLKDISNISKEDEVHIHIFGDKDAKCKDCGFDRTQGCSCNCHKGGIAGFFFKIILFFQKLFRTNQTCSCGVNHY